MGKAKVFYAAFIKKEQLTEDIFSFYFTPEAFDFSAGQYVQIFLPHDDPDSEGSARYFTIASSPTEIKHLMITTRLRQSTFKKALFSLQKGTKVQFFGPVGTFILQED